MHELTKKTEVEKNETEKEKIIYSNIGCDSVFATQKCNWRIILSTNVNAVRVKNKTKCLSEKKIKTS